MEAGQTDGTTLDVGTTLDAAAAGSAHGSASRSDTCAIVVSFNPDVPVLLQLLSELAGQCDFLLIDNHSDNFDEFAPAVRSLRGCLDLQEQDFNTGLATALNLGLRRVREADYRFALLFDQDSAIGSEFVANMLGAYEQALALGPVAAVGARIHNPDNGRRMPFKRFDRLFFRSDSRVAPELFHTDFLISSGTLLPLQQLDTIGLMKEDYFIDNIDLEWCFRARACGFQLYGTDRAVLNHRIGEAGTGILQRLGLMVSHSPLRAYYSTRNRINLYSKSYAPLQWKVRDVFRFLLKSAWLLLFSGARRDYWRQIRRGITDARALS